MAVTALLRRAVRRHAVVPLTAWVLVVALVASGVAFVNRDARTELEHRFRLRVAIASDFVATYVADLLARERVQALQFLAGPQVDQRAFEQSVAALGYPAAVLLDSGGAVVHIAPANPDLIGVDLRERYPHIRTALHFSGIAELSWVLNAYTLVFGGLLLLGGRAGDLFGRRRMFIVGVLIFAFASLAGGFAWDKGWLLAMRALQGVGGAIASPTALSLIATTFDEGKARNRAFGVYAAVSGAGAAIGLILGGLLTDYLSWRWVLFVNAPIGVAIAIAAPFFIAESPRASHGLPRGRGPHGRRSRGRASVRGGSA